ncbi:helix-turn-helix transcriptional regulator [Luteimonas sp. A478]
MTAKSAAAATPSRSMLQALGEKVRARRKALGVSATAAAESAGISRVTWYRIEKGEPSVAAGAYAEAAVVLGLEWALAKPGQSARPDDAEGWLPARVCLSDYPQLRKLAWHVQGIDVLTPREALSIYERNARHLDDAELTPGERALIDALRIAFASDV